MNKWDYRVMKDRERQEDQRLNLAVKPLCKFPYITCTHNTQWNGMGGELKCNYKGPCVKEAGVKP